MEEYLPTDKHDYIKYCIPELTVITFDVRKSISLKLLEGSGLLLFRIGNVLQVPLGQEILWSYPGDFRFQGQDSCKLLVRGQHSVSNASALQAGVSVNLFTVTHIANSASFFFSLNKRVKLHISVGGQNYAIYVTNVGGSALAWGADFTINPSNPRNLRVIFPGSSILLHSSSDNGYTVLVNNVNRKITIIAVEDKTWEDMENAVDIMVAKWNDAIAHNLIGPKVLVTGRRYIGKTSFCYFLINRAIKKGSKPAYVDLDVRGTSTNMSGAINLIQTSATALSCEGFKRTKVTYYFGSTNPRRNYDLYYLLIKVVCEYLNEFLSKTADKSERNAGVVIDMSPTISEDARAIQYILKLVGLSDIVTIADPPYHEVLNGFVRDAADTTGRAADTALIEKSRCIAEHDMTLQKQYEARTVKDFFHGTVNDMKTPYVVAVKFGEIKIFSTVFATPDSTGHNAEKADIEKIPIRPVSIDPDLRLRVLGVSESRKESSALLLSPVKYFVYVHEVDMAKKIITMMSPCNCSLEKEILILGEIKMVGTI